MPIPHFICIFISLYIFSLNLIEFNILLLFCEIKYSLDGAVGEARYFKNERYSCRKSTENSLFSYIIPKNNTNFNLNLTARFSDQ